MEKILFSSAAFIRVEPGGKLIVENGGILTNACGGELWGGILLGGNKDLPQDDVNQGIVELNNGSIIENANHGITVSSGGIVRANNAKFINNAQTVYFYSYRDGTANVYVVNT